MHLEAHAGVGWALGVLAPGSDRRLRNACVLAAVLPDVDTVAYLWGPEAYMNWHHTFGHNVFLGALVVAAAMALDVRASRSAPGRTPLSPGRALARGLVVALAFASHLVGDMKLSAYDVELFWPVSRHGYEFTPNWGLGHPPNTVLVYGSFAFAVLLAILGKPSPLDLISPNLDRIVRNVFRRRTLSCATCARPTNERCDRCGAAACLRHGRIERGFRIRCPACVAASPAPAASPASTTAGPAP